MSFLLTPGVLQERANRAGGKQYALKFDAGDYVDIGSPYPTGNMTVFFNVETNIDVSSNQSISGVQSSANPGGKIIRFDNFTLVSDQGNIHKINLNLNDQKRSVFYQLKDGSLLGYKENSLITSLDTSDAFTKTFNNHIIGVRPDNKEQVKFSGYMYKIIIFSKSLNSSERQSILNGNIITDSLFAHYDFVPGEDLSKLYDKGQNGYHGTIYGANWIEL